MTAWAIADIAWCDCNGRFIFLDLARDRYFQLAEQRDRAFRRAVDQGHYSVWHQPEALPRPAHWTAPGSTSRFWEAGPFSITGVAAALWTQRRVERRLAARSFRDTLIDMRRARDARLVKCSGPPDLAPELSAFAHARLLRTAADRCLPHSIALALRLSLHGIRADVVIGVRSDPFGAHAWTQLGDAVLNDSIEEVRRYSAILVV